VEGHERSTESRKKPKLPEQRGSAEVAELTWQMTSETDKSVNGK
jgi:hypothetical protein